MIHEKDLNLRSEKQFPPPQKKFFFKPVVKTEAGGLCFSFLRDLFTPGSCRAFAGLGLNSVTRCLCSVLLYRCDDTPWLRRFVEGRVCLGLQFLGVRDQDDQAEAHRWGQEAESSHLRVPAQSREGAPGTAQGFKTSKPTPVTWHTSTQPHQLGDKSFKC